MRKTGGSRSLYRVIAHWRLKTNLGTGRSNPKRADGLHNSCFQLQGLAAVALQGSHSILAQS